MSDSKKEIKRQILEALSHAEAEDGLYFNNLVVVHEEEERPVVSGEDEDVRTALDELIRDGSVQYQGDGDGRIFRLGKS